MFLIGDLMRYGAIPAALLLASGCSAANPTSVGAQEIQHSRNSCATLGHEMLTGKDLKSFVAGNKIKLVGGGGLSIDSPPYEQFSPAGDYALTGGISPYRGHYEIRGSQLVISVDRSPGSLPPIRHILQTNGGEYNYCADVGGKDRTWLIRRLPN
jgi:hypothetical protein